MTYTVKQVAKLAGVSVRTLHHYDEVGLVTPSRRLKNGYRVYGDQELLRLQQILFFRELDFSLEDIKKLIDAPQFSIEKALSEQRVLVELKVKRLRNLMKTIDKTLKKVTKQEDMKDSELFEGLSAQEEEAYAKEAKERWGNTEAYKQSQERYGKLSTEERIKIGKAGEELLYRFVAALGDDPASEHVQALTARHYEGLRTFYDPNPEIYRGLAQMYVADPRFKAYYDRFHENLAAFLSKAMQIYADRLSK